MLLTSHGILLAACHLGATAVFAAFYDPSVITLYQGTAESSFMEPTTSEWAFYYNQTVVNTPVTNKSEHYNLEKYNWTIETESPMQAIRVLQHSTALYLYGGYLPPRGTEFDKASADLKMLVDGNEVEFELTRTRNASSITLEQDRFGWIKRQGYGGQFIVTKKAGFNYTLTTGPNFRGRLIIWKPVIAIGRMTTGNTKALNLAFPQYKRLQQLYSWGGEPLATSAEWPTLGPSDRWNSGHNITNIVRLTKSSSVSKVLPRNTSWVQVDGWVGPNLGVLNYQIDPPPPADPSPSHVMARSTKRLLMTRDTLLMAALDPTILYNMTIWSEEATVGEGVYLNTTVIVPYEYDATRTYWDEQEFFTPSNSGGDSGTSRPPDSGSGGVPIPAVVGGVIGGFVAVVLIVTAIWYFCLRRRIIVIPSKAPHTANWQVNNDFEIDDDEEKNVRPYIQPAGPSAQAAGYSAAEMAAAADKHPLLAAQKESMNVWKNSHKLASGSQSHGAALSVPGASGIGPSRGISSEVVQEVDAESVDGDVGEGPSTVPPKYKPEWGQRFSGRGDGGDHGATSDPLQGPSNTGIREKAG